MRQLLGKEVIILDTQYCSGCWGNMWNILPRCWEIVGLNGGQILGIGTIFGNSWDHFRKISEIDATTGHGSNRYSSATAAPSGLIQPFRAPLWASASRLLRRAFFSQLDCPKGSRGYMFPALGD